MINRRAAFGVVTAAVLAASLMGSAFADTNPSNNTSNASAEQAKPTSLVDNLFVNYLGIVSGPSLSDFSTNSHNAFGDVDGTINIDHRVTAGYKLSKEMSLGLYGRIITSVPTAESNGIAYRNPGLKLSHSNLLTKGNFKLSGSAMLYAPVTATSIKNNMITGLLLGQSSTLEIPGSRWSINLLTQETFNAYGAGAPVGGVNDVSLFGYLTLNYQWKSNLALTFGTGTAYDHKMGMGMDGFARTADGTDIEIGASWDVTKKINLSPFMAFFPVEGITANSTKLGMYLTASLL